MNCYLMERTGIFSRYHNSPNQCKGEGHIQYNYVAKLLFDERIKLDGNGFIIDHIDVDKAIQGTKLEGSCEQMHIEIEQALRGLMDTRKVPMIAMKITIIPTIGGVANLTHVWAKQPKHLITLNSI